MALSPTLQSRKLQSRRGADSIERPALTNARDALEKAARFADLSEQAPDDHFESVIHGAYFAMLHAARGVAGR